MRFDASEDGNLSIDRVVSFIIGKREASANDDMAPEAEIRKVLQRLADRVQKLVDQKMPVREVFEQIDTDASGDLDEREFQDGLAKLGLDLTRTHTPRIFSI